LGLGGGDIRSRVRIRLRDAAFFDTCPEPVDLRAAPDLVARARGGLDLGPERTLLQGERYETVRAAERRVRAPYRRRDTEARPLQLERGPFALAAGEVASQPADARSRQRLRQHDAERRHLALPERRRPAVVDIAEAERGIGERA